MVALATSNVLFKETSDTNVAWPVTVSVDPRLVALATSNVLFKETSVTNVE